jgi:hypothetical protein
MYPGGNIDLRRSGWGHALIQAAIAAKAASAVRLLVMLQILFRSNRNVGDTVTSV